MNNYHTKQFVVVLIILALMPISQGAEQPALEAAFLSAYGKWQSVLDAHPELQDGFFFAEDFGPPELQQAVKALLAFEASQTPLLIEQFRRENNAMHLYRLTKLLDRLSGINIYFGRVQEVFGDLPKARNQFMQQWDAGQIQAPDNHLANLRKVTNEAVNASKVEVANTFALRRYGLYGVPFIVREIRKTNSSELFAAFLIITGHQDLYTKYLNQPKDMFTTVEDKLAFIKGWHERGKSKLQRLGKLNENISESVR